MGCKATTGEIMMPPAVLPGKYTVLDAARVMTYYNTGHIIVTDSEGRPLGVLDSHSIVRVIAEGGEEALRAPVASVVDPMVAVVGRETCADNAILAAVRQNVRYAVVLDEQSRIVGIVDVGSIAWKTLQEQVSARPRLPHRKAHMRLPRPHPN